MLGIAGALAVACGGSVDQTGGSGGAATGGKAGSSGAGGSTAGTGGSGGSSGGGGTSGSGGSATGGAGGVTSCCTGDLACASGSECVANSCKPIPQDIACWTDKDCPFGTCVNAAPCPCGTVCKDEHTGQCLEPAKPGCCLTDADCALVNDPPGMVCVSGRCLPPVSDGCWTDSQCAPGESCVGVGVCPCDVVCGVADMPGKCQ
jgi:hypothetical protein